MLSACEIYIKMAVLTGATILGVKNISVRELISYGCT